MAVLADFLNVRKPRKLVIHIDRVYSRCFPVLYEVINRIKTKRFFGQNDPYWVVSGRHKPSYVGQLSVLLIRLEAEAFIYQAASYLERQIGSTPVFTIHDSTIIVEYNQS